MPAVSTQVHPERIAAFIEGAQKFLSGLGVQFSKALETAGHLVALGTDRALDALEAVMTGGLSSDARRAIPIELTKSLIVDGGER